MSKHPVKPSQGKQEAAGGGIPESFAQQLDRLLPQSPYFIDAMTAYRNASADIIAQLLRGMLAAHPEALLEAMQTLQALKLPDHEEDPFPERSELVGMVQERLQPGAMAAGGKKKR